MFFTKESFPKKLWMPGEVYEVPRVEYRFLGVLVALMTYGQTNGYPPYTVFWELLGLRFGFVTWPKSGNLFTGEYSLHQIFGCSDVRNFLHVSTNNQFARLIP